MMRQPDLGLKVAELRHEKGMTQEQLAEYCEVSARTIQRIENGEVEPRPFALNSLSNTLGSDLNGGPPENENLWLAALHISNMFTIVLVPLLIWSWKKKESYKIDQHGRAVLNFQITMTLLLFAAMFFMLVLLPGLLIFMIISGGESNILPMTLLASLSLAPFILIGIFTTYQAVVNTIRVMGERPFHYPLSIPFVK
jgi:uncharacterized Tic20 family protein